MALESSSLLSNFTDPLSNKLYLYLWHTYSPVMYSLYEIDVPNPLPPPPTKDAQDYQIINPSNLDPILQLKTGEYPVNMCCVSLDSKLYFMGGENDIDHPCIDEDVKIKYKNVERDIFPRDVYIFDPTTHSLLPHGTSMNSGKSWPWAFVADEKIYVLGSNFTTDIFRRKDSKLKSLPWFEVYHPKDDNWTILPNPPIGNVETRWVGHAVERRKVFLKARQRGKERLYCFDLDRGQWTKGITLPSHLRNVSGRIEFVEGTFYGCYHNTIAAVAPVAKEDEEDEVEDEDEEDEEEEEEVEEGETEEEKGEELEEEEKEEWEELGEGDELNIQQQQQQQQQQQEDEMCTRFKNYRRHVVSREMGMEAIFNVPQQLQSSSTLFHLGSRCFCYVMTGMPPHPKYGRDHAIEDDKVRVISIVIFRALGETYREDAIRLFRAKFLHSAHYAVKTSFPNEGVIYGCFSLGWELQQPQIEAVGGLQGCHTQQYQAERSPFDKQELGSNILVAFGRDHAEASARSWSIGGGVFLVPPIDVSDSGTGNSSSQRQQRRRDDGERRTLKMPVPRIGNIEIPPEDSFTWRKYGQKEILGSKYPRVKQDQQTKAFEPERMAILNLGENIKIVNKACSVALGAHNSADKPYILQKIRDSPDLVIFGFPGNWSVNDWYAGESFGETEINLELFPSLRSIGIDEHAKVNKAFLQRFNDKVLTNSDFTNKVRKAVTKKKQILFTGHSTGGSIANLATIWFLERYLGSYSPDNSKISRSSPLCVTFGCPLTGNHIFSHALRRENWAHYFIHFVMRYDIVPRILLAPVSSILLEFQRVLQFLNEKSINLAHASINNFDASSFYTKVMKNASSVASHAACNPMGNTNLLLETVTNFIPLSPYKPFGTYVFCTGNGKLVILRNPDAVLQLLFYSSRLCKEEECTDVALRTLQQHFDYESELQDSFQMLNEVYLEPLEQLPLSADSTTTSDIPTINAALNDLGLSTRARLCLCAAGELEKRKIGNKDSIDLKKTDIEKAMKYLLVDYQLNCKYRGLDCYDAFKLQESSKDFDANVKRLELEGIWDEIVGFLKRYELPDAFEGQNDWIDLGTRYRRLVEPLDIANYYRHLKNEDTGAYMDRGRPKRYQVTQRWFEHAMRLPAESSWESCFWAKVEELRIKTSNAGGFAQVKEEVLKLEEQVKILIKGGELGKDVFLEKSTFMKWWNTLPEEHKSKSGIKNLKDL